MGAPNSTVDQNLLPVQAYFDVFGNFQTFIGQGKSFYATANPVQSGLTITNSTLDSSPIGSTSPSTAVFTDMKTTTGQVSAQPVAANDLVNLLALQSYAAGISWKQPCAVATLTNITLSGLQTIDTYTTLAGDRVLVKNQTTQADNGIYIASATAWVRALDANTWNELIAAISFIEYGTQKGGAWFCTAQPGGTLGTTPVIFSQFTTSATYTAGTGLTLTGFQFSITNTGVAASTYGSATATPVFAVNAQGQITSVTNTTITPAIGNVTGLATGMLTFLQTPTSANLAATVTDETGSGALVFATSPTFITPALGTPASGVLTNATGLPLTTGVTGTLPIGNGGTGQTTASAAFNALSPITTTGDLIYGSGANTSSRLAIGSSGQILTVVAGVPAWASLGTIVSSFSAGTTGFTPSTATTGAVTLSGTLNIANGGTGITSFGTGVQTALGQNVTGSGGIALATSPTFVTPVLGTPSSGTLTSCTGLPVSTGISGLGTGVATALAVAVGSAGAFVTNGGALGTPSSGVATNLTGTASGLSIGGNAATATTATTATNATNTAITDDTTTATAVYPTWVTTTTGNLPLKTSSTKMSFIPNTGVLSVTGLNASGLTASSAVATDASKNLVSVTNTGTGNNVLATSPTIASPIITGSTPQITVYTSGSGTYTVPTNARWLQVKMVGGGGGAGGGGTGNTGGGGVAGGNTTFGSSFLTCNGGSGGHGGNAQSTPPSGGTATISTGATGLAVQGGTGTEAVYGSAIYATGGTGAFTPFGGAGGGGVNGAGANAIANTGAGGGGGGTSNAAVANQGGGGGAAGGYLEAVITSLSSTYAYAIGGGGSGGGGVGGGAYGGGSGGSGVIIVTAYF